MEDLTTIKETMTSLEISELTGKRHDHVMRDIHNMLNALQIDAPIFGDTYLDNSNRLQKCFKLPKRECLILGSGYDVVLRTKIIDRWIELETNKFRLPQTYSEALRELANTNEQKEKALLELSTANKTIEQNKPKVVFADSVMGSSNSILVRDFAKVLCDDDFKIGQRRLFEWFRCNKYLMNDNSPYQNYVDMGLFEVIERSVGSGFETFTSRTTKITGKGQVYFAKKIKLCN